MNKFLTMGILVALLALTSSTLQAAQVYVAPAKGSGVSQSDLDTTTTLVQSSLSDAGGATLANSAGEADFTLQPQLMKLGKAYVLSIAKVQNGQTVYSSQLKAKSMDELDKVALRVTQAVLSGKRASDDAQVGEITNQEAHDGTQRRPVRHVTYLGIGGAALSNLNAEHLGYDVGLGTGWDTNRLMVLIKGELAGASAAAFLSGGIGLDYFFTMTDTAPYIGADFGYGAAKADGGTLFSGASRGGFAYAATAGVTILRTSAINMDFGFRAGFLGNTNSYGTPAAYSLRVGLYF